MKNSNLCLNCGHEYGSHPKTRYVNGVVFEGVCLICGCYNYKEVSD